MLNLAEGAKIVCGMVPSTGDSTASDWINTENMHTVWAIVTRAVGGAGSTPFVSAIVGESYAGASPSTPVATYWKTSGLNHIDRLHASTNTSGVEMASSAEMVVIRYDPSVADTSDHYFSLALTSGLYTGAIYICEPRYGGSAQFIATTGSSA